jgi:hypothetical protein
MAKRTHLWIRYAILNNTNEVIAYVVNSGSKLFLLYFIVWLSYSYNLQLALFKCFSLF